MNRRTFVQICSLALSQFYADLAFAGKRVAAAPPLPAKIEHGLCHYQALELIELVRKRELSVLELMQAHLQQIERVNPVLNAICTLLPEQALDEARAMDKRIAAGDQPGPLYGMPIAVKDLTLTRGIRTTLGSPIYKDFIPDVDALYVQRMKAAGAIIIGKTNTPEFGAGSHTFNAVFGITRNPYDPALSCGGSSGGAAVALASGMLPLADGSDMGGSLRNPAAWCNIVGFRPSPGRVPDWPVKVSSPLPVSGPMGRSVRDVAHLLSVMAGPDERVTLSINESATQFRQPLDRDFAQVRIACTEDLGRYPVTEEVRKVFRRALPVFATLGCDVDEAWPQLAHADDIFQKLRAHLYATLAAEDYRKHPQLMKDTVIWNIEKGLQLSDEDISRAEQQRVELVQKTAGFFDKYDYLILPAVQLAPFPVEIDWVKEINGIKLETYIDWMMICCAITVTGLPAISVPCGFTDKGLPIGMQIVGRPGADFEVLQLAYAFEQATQFAQRKPPLCDAV